MKNNRRVVLVLKDYLSLEGILSDMPRKGWELIKVHSWYLKFRRGYGDTLYYRVYETEKIENEQSIDQSINIPEIAGVSFIGRIGKRFVYAMKDTKEFDAFLRKENWFERYYKKQYKITRNVLLIGMFLLIVLCARVFISIFNSPIPWIKLGYLSKLNFMNGILSMLFLLILSTYDYFFYRKQIKSYQDNYIQKDGFFSMKKYVIYSGIVSFIAVLNLFGIILDYFPFMKSTNVVLNSIMYQNVENLIIDDEDWYQQDTFSEHYDQQRFYSYNSNTLILAEYISKIQIKTDKIENNPYEIQKCYVKCYHIWLKSYGKLCTKDLANGYDYMGEAVDVDAKRIQDERFDSLYIGEDEKGNTLIAAQFGTIVLFISYQGKVEVSSMVNRVADYVKSTLEMVNKYKDVDMIEFIQTNVKF